jgi:Domain of unknown function (DUF4907)
MYKYIIFFFILLHCGCNEEKPTAVVTFQSDNGWGYDVFWKGKKVVHQPYLPAKNGNQPFKNQADAQKTGQFVYEKLQKGLFPPTISIQELDSLLH